MVALVVGAGDFIGAAIAKRFAAGGYAVAVGRRNAEKLAPLVAEIAAAGGRARGLRARRARRGERAWTTFATIEREHRAARGRRLQRRRQRAAFRSTETTSRVFRKVWEMACFGGFLTGREAARVMVPRGRGSIFFTGATASVRGGKGYAAFASAKSGLRALAQSLARELGPKNIHVAHLVIDAGVDTAFVRERIRAAGARPRRAAARHARWTRRRSARRTGCCTSQPRDAWTFELDLRPHRRDLVRTHDRASSSTSTSARPTPTSPTS